MKRIVLGIERFHTILDQRYNLVLVYWAHITDQTDKHYYVDGFFASIYHRGEAIGSDHYRFRCPVKIAKDMVRAFIDAEDLPRNAMGMANMRLVTQGQEWTLKVLSWDKNRGEGFGIIEELGWHTDIYGCNATNALTCYNETACIDLVKDSTIKVKLAHMGTHLTPTKFEGVFDQVKADSLDKSKLAFLKKDGKIVSGLGPILSAF